VSAKHSTGLKVPRLRMKDELVKVSAQIALHPGFRHCMC
jgi:hypothetical protein